MNVLCMMGEIWMKLEWFRLDEEWYCDEWNDELMVVCMDEEWLNEYYPFGWL